MVSVRRAESDEELGDVSAVRHAVHPEAAPTIEGYRHQLASRPGVAYFAAYLEGIPVGCGFCGGFGGADDPYVTADASVLPEYRRRGVGSAVARALSQHARSLGKEGLTVEAREDTPEASEFLQKRGYAEVERQKALGLDLEGLDLPPPQPPEGVVIATRADRPDLEREMYEVGVEAGRDIPGSIRFRRRPSSSGARSRSSGPAARPSERSLRSPATRSSATPCSNATATSGRTA